MPVGDEDGQQRQAQSALDRVDAACHVEERRDEQNHARKDPCLPLATPEPPDEDYEDEPAEREEHRRALGYHQRQEVKEYRQLVLWRGKNSRDQVEYADDSEAKRA